MRAVVATKLTGIVLIVFLGTSFSICQGLTVQDLKLSEPMECHMGSMGGFCHKMCEFGREQSPAVDPHNTQNAPALRVKLDPAVSPQTPAPLTVETLPVWAPDLKVFIPAPQAEVYLLNTTFLI